MLHIGLDGGVGELATDQPLGVEDGVGRVHGHLVLGGIADQALGVGERDIGRGGAVTLEDNTSIGTFGPSMRQ